MAPALHTLAAAILRRADEPSDEKKTDPHKGTTDAHDINNTAVFVVFGLIGAAFVCTGIWFFFWAKNGGFYFKENDWDDYKTTVLRRRGPNGTLLTGATPSTNLGGGSVYKDFDGRRGARTGGSGYRDDEHDDDATTALSGITAGASDIAARERREKKRRDKSKEKERRRRDKEHKKDKKHHDEKTEFASAADAAAPLALALEEDAEREAKQHLRSYRHERPARVGGLNAASEASEWDGSTNPADSTVSSTLLSNTTPPPSSRKKAGGIRKVYSTADRTADREQERIRAEARRLAERGRAAGSARRDFSYQRADSNVSESDVGLQRGSRVGLIREESESDVGTRSYRNGIPVPNSPSAVGSDYAEEKRRNRRAGYRRER
ncbi:hypothetical protein VD0002_g4931 [Verticillium dahliae]|uniref:Endosomal spry domain-containing protein n=2 Tax=Verticillium dahliae TaxID=27337 RepID=G2X3U5_VERDV|nr:uncharacterized protein VDAG_04682 [Verticillium dahliae VdLs.17]KAH6662462.1 hypothetical protein EV126DRAFT_374391 [Verticillium dahliae]EGY23244.1 hypothetical protein VDAG_04682 [Verticillium dahliae VdLs.17]KAH6689389.1 hypothetical protein EV126DRAFT_392154 [Verticillium dahliae]PNH27482.1 hypothetical protein BJF96_g9248 [Verticillium dahliae]PNH63433.1 hypothetical protein VD0002_g4931 [Verticillium dahliae]